jgi:hypothetical protein
VGTVTCNVWTLLTSSSTLSESTATRSTRFFTQHKNGAWSCPVASSESATAHIIIHSSQKVAEPIDLVQLVEDETGRRTLMLFQSHSRQLLVLSSPPRWIRQVNVTKTCGNSGTTNYVNVEACQRKGQSAMPCGIVL